MKKEIALRYLDLIETYRRSCKSNDVTPDEAFQTIISILQRDSDNTGIQGLIAFIEDFEKTHLDPVKNPTDWCIRVIEAKIADCGGYLRRDEWTEDLKRDPSTEYHAWINSDIAYLG